MFVFLKLLVWRKTLVSAFYIRNNNKKVLEQQTKKKAQRKKMRKTKGVPKKKNLRRCFLMSNIFVHLPKKLLFDLAFALEYLLNSGPIPKLPVINSFQIIVSLHPPPPLETNFYWRSVGRDYFRQTGSAQKIYLSSLSTREEAQNFFLERLFKELE